MSLPAADWLRAVIQQTVREMLPEMIQAVEAHIDQSDVLFRITDEAGAVLPCPFTDAQLHYLRVLIYAHLATAKVVPDANWVQRVQQDRDLPDGVYVALPLLDFKVTLVPFGTLLD